MGQFAIPLAIIGVGMIGLGLLGPKGGKSTTTQAPPASAPALNSAVRGSPIYVSFGTNRIDAQIVWTNNFQAVRQTNQSQSGKGGGSGGFGSAKGQSGSEAASYLYYWSLVFHFGIMDNGPAVIRQGWVAGDPLDLNTLDNITAGATSTIRATYPINYPDTVAAPTSTLAFSQSFFAPGYPTGSPSLESWSELNSTTEQQCNDVYNYTLDEFVTECHDVSVSGAEMAWPSTMYIGFDSLNLGQTPTVPQLSVEAVQILNDSMDVTPAYIIYRILTSDVFGFATSAIFGFTITAANIDTDSYNAAVAYCEAQGIKCSVKYSTQSNLLNVLAELLALYGGYLVEPGDGIIRFGYQDSTANPVRTLDNAHFVVDEGKPPVKTIKAAREDGYNKVKFKFLDRDLAYNANEIEVADEVDVDLNGPRLKTYDPTFTMPGSVAAKIATRALWQGLYGHDQYQFTLGWKDADLMQGDLVTLVDSFDPILSQGVRARIMTWQENERGKFSVQATQEQPQIISASAFFSTQWDVEGSYGNLVHDIVPVLHKQAYELPYGLSGDQGFVYFGYNQASAIMGAQLYISTDGESYILRDDEQPFVVGGILSRALPTRPQAYVENGLDFYILPASGFRVDSPTFVQSYQLEDISQQVRANGGGILMVDGEAIAVQDLTLLGQNHYSAKFAYRGWGSTQISAHNSGAYFHHHGPGVLSFPITLADIGKTISYKIAPYNFKGELFDISSIDATSYTIQGLYSLGQFWLGHPQPRTKLIALDTMRRGIPEPLTGAFVTVFSGGSDLVMCWPSFSQTWGAGAGGAGASDAGAAGLASQNNGWRIDIMRPDGTEVSSFFVNNNEPIYTKNADGSQTLNRLYDGPTFPSWISDMFALTPRFNYTKDQNVKDFGAFQSSIHFSVTPIWNLGEGIPDTQDVYIGQANDDNYLTDQTGQKVLFHIGEDIQDLSVLYDGPGGIVRSLSIVSVASTDQIRVI